MAPSKEVNDAVGEAPDYTELARRAEALRAVVAQRSEKEAAAEELAEIEQQLAARREAEGVAAARERLIGIKRAYGSLMNTYGEDRQKVRAALAAVADAIKVLNAREGQLRHLREEAGALVARFGGEPLKLPVPREPETEIDVTLPGFWHHAIDVPQKEWDEHHLRERRTFEEIIDTPAFNIIMQAGLVPWPELTEAQKAAVAEREEDLRQQQRSAAEFGREAAAILAMPPSIGGAAGMRG